MLDAALKLNLFKLFSPSAFREKLEKILMVLHVVDFPDGTFQFFSCER